MNSGAILADGSCLAGKRLKPLGHPSLIGVPGRIRTCDLRSRIPLRLIHCATGTKRWRKAGRVELLARWLHRFSRPRPVHTGVTFRVLQNGGGGGSSTHNRPGANRVLSHLSYAPIDTEIRELHGDRTRLANLKDSRPHQKSSSSYQNGAGSEPRTRSLDAGGVVLFQLSYACFETCNVSAALPGGLRMAVCEDTATRPAGERQTRYYK